MERAVVNSRNIKSTHLIRSASADDMIHMTNEVSTKITNQGAIFDTVESFLGQVAITTLLAQFNLCFVILPQSYHNSCCLRKTDP